MECQGKVQDADCLVSERPGFLHGPLWRHCGPGRIDSSKWVVFSPHCIEASFGLKSYGVLRRDRLRFTAALFTKTRVVKLRLRSPLSGTAHSFTRMPKLTTCCLLTSYPCIMYTYPILSSLLSSTPPRHEYILNGTWRSHRNLPCGLYPRPEVFLMTSSFSCMRLSILNYPRV